MKTAMQDLKEDLQDSVKTSIEYLNEIKDKYTREKCKEIAKAVFETIIERIDNELLETEKEQIETAFLEGFKYSGEGFNGEHPFEGCANGSISVGINSNYYEKTFKK